MSTINTVNENNTVNSNETVSEPIQYRTTATGRVTLVGTRTCTECGRHEFHTKKFEKSQNPDDLNTRYTLCKGVCVYCYCARRNKKSGTSLNETQLKAKIQYYTDLLAKTASDEFNAS
jgi:hypothetical protein